MRGPLIVLAVALAAALPAEAERPVQRVPVVFRVSNVNRTEVPCAADGRAYRIRGELLLPERADTAMVTLALHEFSFGRFFWSLPGRADYDVGLAMARAGHPWLSVDRLGYDASDRPVGTATCLGAQADMAAQIVRALVSGDYRFGSAPHGPSFRSVALAGHSVGAGVAELAALTFPSLPITGLALLGWADQGYSADALRQSVEQGADCARGGEPADRGTPGGYAYYGRTPERFRRNMFFDTDPVVADLATALRNRDPCGDSASLARMAVVNRLRIGELALPVLLLHGAHDPIFTADAFQSQARSYSSSPEVVAHLVPRAAHALTLERTRLVVHAHLRDWLAARTAPGRARTVHR